MRRVAFALSSFAACALFVFMLSSPSSPDVVREGDGIINTLVHPRISDLIAEVEATAGKPEAKDAEEDLPEHPADLDAKTWGAYTLAKENAVEDMTTLEFKAARKACTGIRKKSALKCGQLYCAAENECGKPCEKKYAMPPIQVIPLQPGGPKFHRVAEVDVKERHNKELREKELAAKERAVKEHAEKAKEKAAKEVSFKEKISKEKVTKETAMKAHAKEEVDVKKELETEISTKEAEAKQTVANLEATSANHCDIEGQKSVVKCEKEKAAKDAIAAAAAEKATKAAIAKNASNATVTEAEGNMTDIAEDMHDREEKEHEAESNITTLEEFAPSNATETEVADNETETATTNHCTDLDAMDCITTDGCHFEDDECKLGSIESAHPEDVANATNASDWDPMAIVNQCEDDKDWLNEDGDSCQDLDDAFCTEHGETTFPGFGCAANGTNCKTALEACCICKIVANPDQMSCVDVPTWENDAGSHCGHYTITTEWCESNGNTIFPGKGCSLDGHDCLTANDACCTCKTGADPTASMEDSPVAEVPVTADATNATTTETCAEKTEAVCEDGGHCLFSHNVCHTDCTLHSQETECIAFEDCSWQDGACQYPEDETSADTRAATQPELSEGEEIQQDVLKILRASRRLLQTDDVVPAKETIEEENNEVDEKVAAFEETVTATEKAAAVDLEEVEHAAEAATNATYKALVSEAEHNEDVTAADLYDQNFIAPLSDDIEALSDATANETSFMDGFHAETFEHTCQQEREYLVAQCNAAASNSLKEELKALMNHAETEHQHYADEAAAHAEQWGDELEEAKAKQKELEDAEAAAAADLAQHLASEPSTTAMLVTTDETSDDDDDGKCGNARQVAYDQCRDLLNGAYEQCADLYHTEGSSKEPAEESSEDAEEFGSVSGNATAGNGTALQLSETTAVHKKTEKSKAEEKAIRIARHNVANLFEKFSGEYHEPHSMSRSELIRAQNVAWGLDEDDDEYFA